MSYPIGPTPYAPAGYIHKRRYQTDNSLALVCMNERNEPLYTASVKLDTPPQINCVWIKTWSENVGVLEALIDAHIVFPTGRVQPVGGKGAKAIEVELLV